MTLPTGETLTFDGVRRWASLQVSRDPGMPGRRWARRCSRWPA